MNRTAVLLALGVAGAFAASGCAMDFAARPYHRADTAAEGRREDWNACNEASAQMSAETRAAAFAEMLFCTPCIAVRAEEVKRRTRECMIAKGYAVGPMSAQP